MARTAKGTEALKRLEMTRFSLPASWQELLEYRPLATLLRQALPYRSHPPTKMPFLKLTRMGRESSGDAEHWVIAMESFHHPRAADVSPRATPAIEKHHPLNGPPRRAGEFHGFAFAPVASNNAKSGVSEPSCVPF